jgi:dienelactone hydrolase
MLINVYMRNRAYSHFLIALGLSLFVLCLTACQPVTGPYKEVRIPVTGVAGQTLQTFVYTPAGDAQHDVVILSQGSSGGNLKVSEPMEMQALYFVEKGFTVVVPMRKGRGTSDGLSMESEVKNCDVTSWLPGIDSALDDVSAAIEYADTVPGSNHRVILAGVSRGGYLSVAYGARGKYKDRVDAVISFAGSWVAQTEDQCSQDFNLVSFSEFGGLKNPPNLWLYAENDGFNDAASIKMYYADFSHSDPQRGMVMYTGLPGNGHFIADHRDFWEKDVTAFLDHLGYK